MSAPLARRAWQLSELTKISILCLKHRSFEGYMLHSGSHFLDMCQNVWNMAHLDFSGCGSTVKDRNGRKQGRGSRRQPPGLLLNTSHLLIHRTNDKLCILIKNSAQAFLSKYIHIAHCILLFIDIWPDSLYSPSAWRSKWTHWVCVMHLVQMCQVHSHRRLISPESDSSQKPPLRHC